jgi:cysteine desulfurase family protein (TIGR01976 family)
MTGVFDSIVELLMSEFPIRWVRSQFPALAQGHLYLDAPGGTQVPQRVIDSMSEYLARYNANNHGLFSTSRRTDEVISQAHQAMGDLLNCRADEIVFGANMTTLTFALSRAIGRELGPGDEVVLTRLDHDANFSPWKALEERGVTVRVADIREDDCTLDMASLAGQINGRTKLVAVGYASNAVGTINDVAAVVKLAHAAGALAFIDAVHYAPHGPIDVAALDCDFLACSPYKFFAPHQGVLYGKKAHWDRLTPYKVRPALNSGWDRWETGTQNHEALAGTAAAIEYLAELGQRIAPGAETRRGRILAAMEAIREYERGLGAEMIAGLLRIPELRFYGLTDPARFCARTPTVSIRLANETPQQTAQRLGERGIFVWDGNFYALNLTERLGVESSGGLLRIGLAHYNTLEEVHRLLNELGRF